MRKTKQIRRLLKLADVVERHEGHFDMSRWGQYVGEEGDTIAIDELDEFFDHLGNNLPVSCGMTACLGGWAVHLWPEDAKKSGYSTIEYAAQQVLGYDEDSINRLFVASAPWQTAEDATAELRRRAAQLLDQVRADV